MTYDTIATTFIQEVMEQEKIIEVLDFISTVDCTAEQKKTLLEMATNSLSLNKLNSLVGTSTQQPGNNGEVFWKLSEKELSLMPKTFRKEFRIEGCTAHIRKRQSGKNSWNYEIRYRRNGYNIAVSSNNLNIAKQKFIHVLHTAESEKPEEYNPLFIRKRAVSKNNDSSIPTTLDGFSNYFFENFYKRKVKDSTHRIALNQYKNHILPHFGNVKLNQITPKKCQELLDKLDEEGKGKTADDVHSLLNMIFKAAVKHCIMQNNPIDMVFHQQHEREHGSALTKEEENQLLEAMAGTPQQIMFAVALYTGMRPNEYETARIEGNFIVANNSKRKGGKVEFKKIPITPMLKPYLEGIEELKFSSLRILRDRFNRLYPNHRLYDLRTTFYTRCQECGVLPVARDKFVGHSLGELGNTYTDVSDEFLYREGQKLKY